jgi:hypothetical protein
MRGEPHRLNTAAFYLQFIARPSGFTWETFG